MAELHLDVITSAQSAGLTKAAKDLKETRGEADKLGKSFDSLGDDAFDLEKAIEKQRIEVKKLADEFKRTGDQSLVFDIRKEKSFLRDLEMMGKEVSKVGEGAGDDFMDGVTKSMHSRGPRGGMVLGGLITHGVLVAAAPLGAMLAGLVAGAIGTVGVAGGITMAARDERVQTAVRNFGKDIADEFFGGGSNFVEPILNSLSILKNSFHDLNLDDTFAKMVPSVEKIAHGLGNMLEGMMPGLNAAFDRMGPFADAAAEGLEDFGKTLGMFMDDVSRSPGAAMGLEFAFNTINNVIGATGKVLYLASEGFENFIGGLHSIVRLAQKVPDELVPDFWKQGINDLDTALTDLETHAGDYTGSAKAASDATGLLAKSGGELYQEALDAADAIQKLNSELYEMTGFQLDAEAQADRLAKKVIDLTDSVRENGTSLDGNTEAGLRNREMLRGLVQGLRDQHDADILAGMSAQDAKTKYEAQALALQYLALDLGFAKDRVAELIGQYKLVPSVITTEFRQIFYQIGGGNAPGEHSGVRIADYGGRRAGGGSVRPGMAYTVGEEGPETLVMGSGGGYVIPHGRAMGGAATVTLSFAATGDPFLDALIRELRRYIRIDSGGDVQVALGQN